MALRNLTRLFSALCILLLAAQITAGKGAEAETMDLINSLGCKGCHKLRGDGGSLAPELDQIGSRMTREQISKHMAAHAESRQQRFMPSYDTTSKSDLNKISDFLYNLK